MGVRMLKATIIFILLLSPAASAVAQDQFTVANGSNVPLTVYLRPTGSDKPWTVQQVPVAKKASIKLVSPGPFDLIIRENESPDRIKDFSLNSLDLRQMVNIRPGQE